MNEMQEGHPEALERLKRRERELQALQRITAALHARTSPHDQVRQTLDAAVDVVGANAGSILLHDPKSAQLRFEYVTGPAAVQLTGVAISDHLGIVGQVFHAGQGCITRDSTDDPGTMITVPLKTPSGQVIGAMQMLNKQQGEFDIDDLAVLEILSTLAASIIDTARLYEQSKLVQVAHLIGDISLDVRNMVTPVVTGTQTLDMMLQESFAAMDSLLADQLTPVDLAAGVREAFADVREFLPEALEMIYEGTAATQERAREMTDAIRGVVARPEFARTNLNEIVEAAAKYLKVVADKGGVILDLSGLGDVPPADLDRKRIYNALYSLINNAIPETPRGGRVSLSTTGLDANADGVVDTIEIVVADTGRGIPENVRQRLFTDNTVSTRVGGTGLGTRIIKNVVDAHGGTITVASDEGAGSTFTLRLPLRQTREGEQDSKSGLREEEELSIQRAVQIRQMREEEREKQVRLEQELAIGRAIQMSLLAPRRVCLESYEILSRSEPATEVGGDFYNLFALGGSSRSPALTHLAPPARLGVVLGDVAGKGVPAALFMAVTTTLIRGQAQLLSSPAETLAAANAELHPLMRQPGSAQPLFATAVYGVLELASGELRLANAGQTPPIYWPTVGDPRYVRLSGLPLGALPASQYEEVVIRLISGDRLLFCSDGFIEEQDAAGQQVGYEGFLRRLGQLRELSGPDLVTALFEVGSAPLSGPNVLIPPDDRTLVLITAVASPVVPS
jgi:serine phosphatase RsbU (regulator of sigma subunit)/signal transduction histidine kinase